MSAKAPGREDPKGRLLVALPEMRDPHFHQTIILIINHHARNGTSGLILNRPLGKTLIEVAADDLDPNTAIGKAPVYWGGPVNPSAVAIGAFDRRATSRRFVMRNAAPPERLAERYPIDRIHAYVGYCGWAPGQLSAEIAEGSWRLTDTDISLLKTGRLQTAWAALASGDERWRNLLGRDDLPEGGN